MILLLLGAPGAGKGTQAEVLRDTLGMAHVSSGDLFRVHMKNETPLGREAKAYYDRGELVPDSITIKMILNRLDEPDTVNGVILDGFPRTVAQAEALEAALDEVGRSLTAALLIEAPDDEIVKRISGRRQCKNGHIYNVYFDPPKHDDVCDSDGLKLFQRDDDKPETVRKRLETYRAKTEPLVEFYDDRGILKRFDGSRSPTEVHDHIRATLATLRLEEQI